MPGGEVPPAKGEQKQDKNWISEEEPGPVGLRAAAELPQTRDDNCRQEDKCIHREAQRWKATAAHNRLAPRRDGAYEAG